MNYFTVRDYRGRVYSVGAPMPDVKGHDKTNGLKITRIERLGKGTYEAHATTDNGAEVHRQLFSAM